MQASLERNKWVRCPNCSHKLFRFLSDSPFAITLSSEMYLDGLPKLGGDSLIEIKCHSCKEIAIIEV